MHFEESFLFLSPIPFEHILSRDIMKTTCTLCWLLLFLLSARADNASLDQFQTQLKHALDAGNSDSIAAAYCRMSEYYAYRNSDSAHFFCKEGLKYADKNKPEPYLTLINNLADTYFSAGKMDIATQLFLSADKEAVRLAHSRMFRVSVLTSIGVTYRRREMPDSALFYYNKALGLLEGEENSISEEIHLLTSIAVLYANTSRLSEAENYVRRAMKKAEKCDDMDMTLYAAATAGSIFILQKNYAEASRVILPVLEKARQQQKPKFELKCLTFLLSIFRQTNNKDSINHYMKEADRAAALLPENSTEVMGYRETQFQILSSLGKYRESLAIQHRILKEGSQNIQTPVDNLYKLMARNYAKLNEYRQAAAYYEKCIAASDSLRKEAIDAELSELTVKYETQEKELEIAQLNEEQLSQKAQTMRWTIAAIGLSGILLLLALWYALSRRHAKRKEELNVARSYIEGLEQERARLAKELHDGVCNDLLGIGLQLQALPIPEDSRNYLLNLTEQIREDVRSVSHELMPPKFQHTTLDEMAEAYIARFHMPHSIQVTMNKESKGKEWNEIPERTAYETYRIMQELLSNIVRHANATKIEIDLLLEEHTLTLRIKDNGNRTGKCPEAANAGGIGRTTIAERIKITGGTFAEETDADMQTFTLTIPL